MELWIVSRGGSKLPAAGRFAAARGHGIIPTNHKLHVAESPQCCGVGSLAIKASCIRICDLQPDRLEVFWRHRGRDVKLGPETLQPFQVLEGRRVTKLTCTQRFPMAQRLL